SDLLNDILDFLSSELLYGKGNPVKTVQSLDELMLDIHNDPVANLLSLFTECLLNKETPKNPSKLSINGANASLPAFLFSGSSPKSVSQILKRFCSIFGQLVREGLNELPLNVTSNSVFIGFLKEAF